ncbi:DUF3558 domain-containing protein [Nocardia rosealba]|uniref:DUF3558 domain-containing protein n=1 Tax=Nocardia rosealba TaxID=2878563 RepID=UPI001CD9B930|nr:DUF3558 domain-containing protein [Nocardia rosealba]MCA2210136.1 DUF3558 domain-containing protein [Nocardia rosealba]
MRAVVCGAVGAAVLAGCGESTEGSAGPTTTVRDPDTIEVFNPCRGALSDEVLRSVGLDPATKLVTTDPPSGVSAWRVCSWAPLDRRPDVGRTRVAVLSTSHSLAEGRQKASLVNLRDTEVNGRPGFVSQERDDPDSCYVSFAAEQGMFEVKVGWLSTEGPRVGDTCSMAADYATALEPNLPK